MFTPHVDVVKLIRKTEWRSEEFNNEDLTLEDDWKEEHIAVSKALYSVLMKSTKLDAM